MPHVSRATHGFVFGPFELDSDTGELRSGGTPVHLQPQPTQILKILLENHGKLVTREQIQQQLWSEETFVEFEVGLNQSIKKLREALGDSAQTPVYIETIPRKGYRFSAEVREMETNGPTDPLLGRVLGHYRLVERIGQGGMGIVYRAHDEHLQRDVAIKILPRGAVADETSRRRFRKEAMALAQLNHPNVASVSDFDTQAGIDYLVEELVPGSSLDQMLMAGPLTEKQILDLGSQLCQGLAAAHGQGVIHRDIKPANLRVTPDGRLKILDFGLAAVLHASKVNVEQDATASVVEAQATSGTLPYMAPEQLLNETLDARTDLWAAGCVLYEMATGRLPFGGDGMALADAILHQVPVRPSEINRKVSPALEATMLKCLEKDPALRYGSAREMSVDLNRIGRTAQGPILKTSRQPIWVRAVVGAILLLSVIVSGYAIWKYVLPRISPKPRVAAGSSRKVVAVLYFKNMSQDPSLNWLNGGLTEMMTTNLDQVGGMEVLSTDRIASIRKRLKIKPDQELSAENAPEVAREAGADAYLTGTLVRLGPSRLRVDVHLQEVSTGKIIFSDKVESPDLNGVFTMVDTITLRLAESVLPSNGMPATAASIEEVTTSNVEALRHFQAGTDYQRRFFNEEAIREHEQAVRLDPQFAKPYLKLLTLYPVQDEDKRRNALHELEVLKARMPRAEQLEYEYVRAMIRGDRQTALQAREALLRDRPHDSLNRYILAVAVAVNEPERAITILREGLVLDPKDHLLWNGVAYTERNENIALQASDRHQALLGDSDPNGWDTRGDILCIFERYDEAEAAYRKEQEIDPAFGAAIKLAILHSQQGRTALALDGLRRYRSPAVRDRVDASMVEAQLPQAAGEPEAALPLYRKAISRFVREGQPAIAASLLTVFATFAIVVGEEQAGLEFVQSQQGQDSQLAVSLLQASLGHESAAETALVRFSLADPGLPKNVGVERDLNEILLALRRGNREALARALPQVGVNGRIPITGRVPISFVPFIRGRAALVLNDYSSAERDLLMAMRQIRDFRSSPRIRSRMPVIEHLCHFYLGQVYEATNRRAEAIGEYQSFLSHYSDTRSRSPEIPQARAALKRLRATTPQT